MRAELNTPALSQASPPVGLTSRIFAFLWASAHIFHAWHKGPADLALPLTDPLLILVLLAGFAVLLRPSSPHRLAGLAGTQLVVFAFQLPFVANHWTLAAFMNAGILFSYLVSRRSPPADSAALVAHVAPHGRVAFLVAYVASALAKLNTTFLHPDHSCALDLLEHIAVFMGFGMPTSDPERIAVITTVTVVEIAIPILLLARRTRLFGIAFAAVFHLVLAATPTVLVMDFTAFILALLILFAPADIGDRLAAEARGFSLRRPAITGLIRRVWARGRLGLALVLLGLAIGRGMVFGPEPWAVLTWTVLLLYGTLVVFFGLLVLNSYRGEFEPPTAIGAARSLHFGHALLIVALAVNASSPYIGLKTTSSFTMFSNLRTEGNTTNHLFLPRVGRWTFQDDIIEVLESSNAYLAGLVEEGQETTYHELRRVLRGDPEASVTFIRGGATQSFTNASDNPELVTLPFIERKLLHFRTLTPGGNPICQP